VEHLTREAVGTQLKFCCVRQQRSNRWARYTQRDLQYCILQQIAGTRTSGRPTTPDRGYDAV